MEAVSISYPPIIPIEELSDWTRTLQRIAAEPLAFCPDFPTIARRFEAWWAHECLDRPIFIGTANTDPSRPITRRLELLRDPDAWFEAKYADLQQLHRVGDALPHIRADFGPVLLGGMLGGRLEFGADTGWTHAFIKDDWSNAPDRTIRGGTCCAISFSVWRRTPGGAIWSARRISAGRAMCCLTSGGPPSFAWT
jgi:hypothetical protein